MGYENDTMMRQIRDMGRMLAKVIYGKNTAEYEFTEKENTAEDSLYRKLINMVDMGQINNAENILYDELEKDDVRSLRVAIGFYDYLNNLSDEFLEENDYSREEVKDGAKNLADRRGLGVLGEDI